MRATFVHAAHDSDNLLKLLTQLRDRLPSPNLNPAATSVTVFAKNGRSMGDVSAFASLLDHVYPMVYDITGDWEDGTGRDAPMSSFSGALDNWIAAGFRKTQLILGVPLHGKTFCGKAMVDLPYKDQIRVVDSWDRQWDVGEQAATWFNKNKQVFGTLPDPQLMRSRTDWAMKHAGGVMTRALEHDNGDRLKAIDDTVRSGPMRPPSPSKATTAHPPAFTTQAAEQLTAITSPETSTLSCTTSTIFTSSLPAAPPKPAHTNPPVLSEPDHRCSRGKECRNGFCLPIVIAVPTPQAPLMRNAPVFTTPVPHRTSLRIGYRHAGCFHRFGARNNKAFCD
ncbi:hypothetical protein HDU89_001558 [Geranomyces variabilis]|nr:hypothetical protein HDU89_001558 [Geranomyces variabilis]